MTHFISVEQLSVALEDTTRPPFLIDLRFDPGHGSTRARFDAGHIPTARFAALETVFAGAGNTGSGNAPLPAPEAFEAALRELGLDNTTDIVVYDDTSGGPSARAWWTLTWAGAQRVRVLDGGLRAWTAQNRPLVTEEPPVVDRPGSFSVRSGQLRVLDVDDVTKKLDDSDTALIDTRGGPQFAGDPASPRTGHIPGAHNVPQPRFTNPDGTVADRDHIVSELSAVGAENADIILYCGAGVSSAYAALALSEYGVPFGLYPGSFSEWAASPSRPVEQS